MKRISLAAASIALLLAAAAAQAGKPQTWSFSTQKDFAQGKFDNSVVDSYGQLALGRELAPIDTAHSADMVAAFAQTPDGAIYVATNPDPKIFRIEGDKSTIVFSAPKGTTDITAMAADAKGNLLVALAGKKARLIQITPGDKAPPSAITTKFENENVETIWDIAQASDGALYLGTGPHGKVYKVGESAEGSTVLDTTAKNVISLAFDKDANLIAGTDAKGLVIRLDGKTKKPFVLFDAGKVDVNAIVVDKTGALYIATALTSEPEKDSSDSDEPDTKSQPGDVIPEPLEPPAGDEKKGPAGSAPQLAPAILAADPPALPPELKALLKKAAAGNKDGPATQRKTIKPSSSMHSKSSHHAAPSSDDEGENDTSAVYRIAPDGLVTTLMQQEDVNYSLLVVGDDLLIGTGHDGKLFQYRTADQSTTLLARLKEENVTALFAAKAGDVLIGAANMAQVYRLGSSVAKKGTFTSQVLDAQHTAHWGHAALEGLPALPDGTKVTISTRTGNTRSVDGDNAKFWSDWSAETDPASAEKISSPAARFLQFRITLTGNDKSATPVIGGLRLGYQTENLPPKIKAVSVETPSGSSDDGDKGDLSDHSDDADAPPKIARIEWDASDPNNDTLEFRLLYRPIAPPGPAGPAAAKDEIWTPLAKNLKDSSYEWDTRALPDGKYQVKVIASDKPDNTAAGAKETARESAPFTIDHTPPVLGELKASVDGNKATLSGDATDALSAVTDVRYQIDGQGDWQPAAASDKIFDSAHAAFSIVTVPLSTGGHRITVRATDAQGNSGYKSATVVVKP